MTRAFYWLRRLALLTLLVLALPMAHAAQAATITVSTLADSGAGSLRVALSQANAAPGSTITFSVAGAIALASPLPAITADGTTIDGTVSGVPKIELRGGGAVANGIVLNASNSVVRGLIINGFTGAGVLIDGQSRAAKNNRVETSYIGTDAAGTAAGFLQTTNNVKAGVQLTRGASSNTVRDNIIAGNGGYGVDISALSTDAGQQNENIVANNRIGVNGSGAALSNTLSGVQVSFNSNSNVVGPDNVISGNGLQTGQYGVFISGSNADGTFIKGNLIQGNKIGTDPTGTTALPNFSGGVLIGTSDGTLVGGPDGNPTSANPKRGNLISGNSTTTTSGVRVQVSNVTADDVKNTVIQNNWIGLNLAGTAALKNDLAGVLLAQGANGVTVSSNVISGNYYGVYVLESTNQAAAKQTRNNTIASNLIGTNVAGTAAVPNAFIGVFLRGGVWGNTITNNRISGNGGIGIDTDSDTNIMPTTGLAPYNNTISGNQIGTLVGSAPIGNGTGGAGIYLESGTNGNVVSSNVISGNAYGVRIATGAVGNLLQKNAVQNNTTDGISITDAATLRNKITQTTTSGNGGANGKGIRLATGGNAGIATPTVTGLSATATSVSGSVSTTANCATGCTIEIFDATTLENFEGPFYLAAFTLASNGAFTVSTARACQRNLTFTITDPTGNTSEFSAAQAVAGCTGSAPQASSGSVYLPLVQR